MATNGEECSESEPADLQQKVKLLKHKLKRYKSELHKLRRKLGKTEQLQKNTERYNDDLRKQVDKLSAEIHDRKKREKNRTDAETQTEDYSSWTETDYYNYYYGNYQCENDATEAQGNSRSEVPENHGTTESCQAGTECVPEDPSVPLKSGSTAKSEETDSASIADIIRATAEEAVSQTGFVFDENSGMYYDHSTGFYYDSTSQLYYDANTGMYYYYDAESGRYQFHSRVEVQPYQALPEPNQDKKGKKRRKGTEKSLVQDKNLRDEGGKEDTVGRLEQKRKRTTVPSRAPRRSCSPDLSEGGEVVLKEDSKTAKRSARNHAGRRGVLSDNTSSESEPEEGEITESDREQNSTPESSTADSSGSEREDPEVSEEAWPPCVRVTVIRSPVLQTGTLFIITADTPATFGREKDMDHAIRIPEVGVSKFHAEVHFDQDLQCYVLVDQGSQNGTVINGNRVLQPKAKSEPCALAHGDEIKMGETVLSFHIHSGNDTCDGCEPGQVIAHLSRHRREEAGGPVLSEDKEVKRQKELKQMKVKYGLKNSEYEGNKILKNCRYKDRAEKRRQLVGSEGTFQRDDAPASVHVEIGDGNKGRKMLEKMGWKRGEGLGKKGSGRKEPIQLQIRKSQVGLGVSGAVSVDGTAPSLSKNQKNWEKARERFADKCQTSNPPVKDKPKSSSWVKGEVNEPSKPS